MYRPGFGRRGQQDASEFLPFLMGSDPEEFLNYHTRTVNHDKADRPWYMHARTHACTQAQIHARKMPDWVQVPEPFLRHFPDHWVHENQFEKEFRVGQSSVYSIDCTERGYALEPFGDQHADL